MWPVPRESFHERIANIRPHPEQFEIVVGRLFAAVAKGGHFRPERIA
jgi:hypothetical protein